MTAEIQIIGLIERRYSSTANILGRTPRFQNDE
jgi:hypothetical protein